MSTRPELPVGAVLTWLQGSWNEGDGDRWAGIFAVDAVFIDVFGRIHRGRSAIADEYHGLFETVFAGSRLEMWPIHFRRIGDGASVIHSGSRLTVPGGPRAGSGVGVQTLLVDAGEVLTFHNTVRVAPPGSDGDISVLPELW